ncbi:MAG: hypothetical protein ACT4NL_17935 [Pseudomarimonas sp.]
MNERQRDMFLWQWSRRRRPGRFMFAIRGAVIGALGGVLFAWLMFFGMDEGANRSTAAVLSMLQSGLLMVLAAIPAFAMLGLTAALRVYSGQEAIYQQLLLAGHPLPSQAPSLQAGDRGPAIAVGIAVLVIIGCIVALFMAYG